MSKAQVNLDIIFGYMTFLILIYYFAGLTVDLYTPFLDKSRTENNLKKNLVLVSLVKVFDYENFEESCDIFQEGLSGISTNYKILGQRLDSISLEDSFVKGVSFWRVPGFLKVKGYSNNSPGLASFSLLLPPSVIKVSTVNFTSFDNYVVSKDEQDNNFIEVNLSFSSEDDYKELLISHNVNYPSYYFLDSFSSVSLNYFFEKIPGRKSCFKTEVESEDSIFFEFFSDLGSFDKDLVGFVSVESWWNDEI